MSKGCLLISFILNLITTWNGCELVFMQKPLGESIPLDVQLVVWQLLTTMLVALSYDLRHDKEGIGQA